MPRIMDVVVSDHRKEAVCRERHVRNKPCMTGLCESAVMEICRGTHRSIWVSMGGPRRASCGKQSCFFVLGGEKGRERKETPFLG